MENLRDKVQEKWLEQAFTSSMNYHPEEWDNVRGSPAIKSKVYSPRVLLRGGVNKLDAMNLGHKNIMTNLKKLPDTDLRNGMDFLHISRNRHCWWCFNFCIQHFEDTLERLILNDGKWPMAFKNPARDKISKFGFVVRRSMGIVRDTLGVVDNLPLAGFDMADEVRGRIFLAFTGKDDRGVPILLYRNQMHLNKRRLTCDRQTDILQPPSPQ